MIVRFLMFILAGAAGLSQAETYFVSFEKHVST